MLTLVKSPPQPRLAPVEIAAAAALWLTGADTAEIARDLRVREAAVANSLPQVRAAADAASTRIIAETEWSAS